MYLQLMTCYTDVSGHSVMKSQKIRNFDTLCKEQCKHLRDATTSHSYIWSVATRACKKKYIIKCFRKISFLFRGLAGVPFAACKKIDICPPTPNPKIIPTCSPLAWLPLGTSTFPVRYKVEKLEVFIPKIWADFCSSTPSHL